MTHYGAANTATLTKPRGKLDPVPKPPADNEWTADQCAEHLGIQRDTWTSYVYRKAKGNAAPDPIRYIGRTPLWDAAAVREFGLNRSRDAPPRKA